MKMELEQQIVPETEPGVPVDAVVQARLQEVGKCVRRELRRHFLSERERIVADVLVEISFGFGLREVRIPKLDTLADLTGIPRPHVHGALKALHQMRILAITAKEGMAIYRLQPDSDAWKVKVRVPRATIMRGVEMIQELNHLPGTAAGRGAADAGGPTESFRVLPDAHFLGAGVTDSVSVTTNEEAFPQL